MSRSNRGDVDDCCIASSFEMSQMLQQQIAPLSHHGELFPWQFTTCYMANIGYLSVIIIDLHDLIILQFTTHNKYHV